MKPIFIFLLPLVLTTACSTLNESLELGAGLGAASGAAAAFASYSSLGAKPPGGAVALSAGVGLGVGLLTSYLVHRRVETDRTDYEADQVEMHFGDLPPSPFIVPKALKKGGKR